MNKCIRIRINLLQKMNLFARLIIMLTLVGVTSGYCYYCNRCVDDTCIDPVNNRCTCEYGCKPGYYGSRCLNECPQQCYTCGREYEISSHPTYRICYECKVGYHNGSSTNCLCPINCQQCTSTTQCTLCYQGWYGAMCQTSCPSNCKDNTCSQSDGMCTNGCITESFIGDNCNDCKSGLYGEDCDLICSTNCKEHVCKKADGYCTNGCRNGWYGTSCNLQCSFFCSESECHQNDGVCYECISGKYKSYCETDCKSDTCLYNKCDRNSGLCTIGCSGKLILGTDNLCQACKAGKYGSTCENDCLSQNCKDNKCDKITGTCIDECNGNYLLGSDKLCEPCIAGKYGQDCNTECPSENCFNNRCDKENGTCTHGCYNGFQGYTCEQETTDDTSTNISFVIGWVFGGCCFTVNVALVIYICYKRRHTTTAETKRKTEGNDNQVAYINTGGETEYVSYSDKDRNKNNSYAHPWQVNILNTATERETIGMILFWRSI